MATLGIKRDLLNQVLTLGASGAEGSGKAPKVGPLSHMPLWPIMLMRLSPGGRGTQRPFLQGTNLHKASFLFSSHFFLLTDPSMSWSFGPRSTFNFQPCSVIDIQL